MPARHLPPSGLVGWARYEDSSQYQPGSYCAVGASRPGLPQYQPGVHGVHELPFWPPVGETQEIH